MRVQFTISETDVIAVKRLMEICDIGTIPRYFQHLLRESISHVFGNTGYGKSAPADARHVAEPGGVVHDNFVGVMVTDADLAHIDAVAQSGMASRSEVLRRAIRALPR